MNTMLIYSLRVTLFSGTCKGVSKTGYSQPGRQMSGKMTEVVK